MTKVVKHKIVDQDDTEATPDKDTAADAAANAATLAIVISLSTLLEYQLCIRLTFQLKIATSIRSCSISVYNLFAMLIYFGLSVCLLS
jgi:hypothetical protein